MQVVDKTGVFASSVEFVPSNYDGCVDRANNDLYEFNGGVRFDASAAVPTAHENRPMNYAVLLCIKY